MVRLGLEAQLGGQLGLSSNDLSNYNATGNLIIKELTRHMANPFAWILAGFYKHSLINDPNLDIDASYVLNGIRAEVALQSIRVMVHILVQCVALRSYYLLIQV